MDGEGWTPGLPDVRDEYGKVGATVWEGWLRVRGKWERRVRIFRRVHRGPGWMDCLSPGWLVIQTKAPDGCPLEDGPRYFAEEERHTYDDGDLAGVEWAPL